MAKLKRYARKYPTKKQIGRVSIETSSTYPAVFLLIGCFNDTPPPIIEKIRMFPVLTGKPKREQKSILEIDEKSDVIADW